MTKEKLTASILVFGLLLSIFAATHEVAAQSDFSAFLGSSISDSNIDGTIGNEWDDAGKYNGINIDPVGTAEIWTKHDNTNLYIAVRFAADSNNPWIAILLGGSTCMAPGTDGALFGDDNFNANGYADVRFGGIGSISGDANSHGRGAMNLGSSNIVTVELKKPLNSGDQHDITWTVGNTYSMLIMWDSDGGGSSGGIRNHQSASLNTRTILINSNIIPELSSITFTILLVGITAIAIFIRRRQNRAS